MRPEIKSAGLSPVTVAILYVLLTAGAVAVAQMIFGRG
jgi:hypothetical protein